MDAGCNKILINQIKESIQLLLNKDNIPIKIIQSTILPEDIGELFEYKKTSKKQKAALQREKERLKQVKRKKQKVLQYDWQGTVKTKSKDVTFESLYLNKKHIEEILLNKSFSSMTKNERKRRKTLKKMINKDFNHLIRQHDDYLLLNFLRILNNNNIFTNTFSDDRFRIEEIYSFFDSLPFLYFNNNLIENQEVIIDLSNFNSWIVNNYHTIKNQKYDIKSNKKFKKLLTEEEQKTHRTLLKETKNCFDGSIERDKQVELFKEMDYRLDPPEISLGINYGEITRNFTRFNINRIEGNGNCLFEAIRQGMILQGINEVPEDSDTLRIIIMGRIRARVSKNESYRNRLYEQIISDGNNYYKKLGYVRDQLLGYYLEVMSQPIANSKSKKNGTEIYGGFPEMTEISSLFRVRIGIITANIHDIHYVYSEGIPEDAPIIYIYYLGQNHYNLAIQEVATHKEGEGVAMHEGEGDEEGDEVATHKEEVIDSGKAGKKKYYINYSY